MDGAVKNNMKFIIQNMKVKGINLWQVYDDKE